MNPDHDFRALRKLMALKRHEQPPAEYLDDLSGSIIDRIEQGDGQLSLLDRVSGTFAMHPYLAYACGLTICGALGISAVYIAREGMRESSAKEEASLPVSPMAHAYATPIEPVNPPIHVANWVGNTNQTETQASISLFDTTHSIIPVSYEPAH